MTDNAPWWTDRAHYWKQTLAGVSLTFAILATIFYGLRIWASKIATRRVRADDIWMGFAVFFMWAETASVLLKCFNGVGIPSTELPDARGYQLRLGSWLVAKFSVLSMVSCRMAIILFFRTVFGVHDRTRYVLNGLAVFNIVWGIVCLMVSLFSCTPVTYYWDKNTPGGWCINTKIYNNESLAFSVLGLVMDLGILATPQSRLWKLQMRKSHQRAIATVLGVGVVVCVFSLLRCIQFAYFDTAHLSTSGNLETIWTFLENDVSIICGCMPQLRPLFPSILNDGEEESEEHQCRSGTFVWGHKIRGGVSTTITSSSVYESRGRTNARNSSEMELNAIEVETEVQTTVTRDDKSMTTV